MPEPRIACIGVIGKAVRMCLHVQLLLSNVDADTFKDNPLHISLFPPYGNHNIDFSFILNSCLDIFEIRQKQTSIDQDLGLLYAMDERLAAYGWLTTTGVKFLVIIDLLGQSRNSETEGHKGINGPTVKESDLKPVGRPCYLYQPWHVVFHSRIMTNHGVYRCFGACRPRTFGCYKILFTSQMLITLYPNQLSRRLMSYRSLIRSSSRKSNGLVNPGCQA